MKRKDFLRTLPIVGSTITILMGSSKEKSFAGNLKASPPPPGTPVVLSTWNFNLPVNQTAVAVLESGGSVVDAVEKSISLVESDPKITSVGRGGYPDRDGHLTLDACIMDEKGNAGSVLFLENIMHPISVARKVMEKTPHVILAGDGALQFAVEQGFTKEELMTDGAKKAYHDWLKSSGYKPQPDKNNHDTIGLLVMNGKGDLAGGCSTSGLAWKMHGRVGDSPIIGAGLYVDNEVGAASSTGLGEAVIKVSGSFLVVESMRNGATPQEGCMAAITRIIKKQPQYKDIDNFLVGFIAVNKKGEIGACSYRKGLQYSLMREGINRVVDADYLVK
jgi:N4-(beta-N-acetylglucosaminyl)-L-asparaginase